MCGICGIINEKIDVVMRNATLQKMNEAIVHRGPDEDGFYSDTHCSLAMRRLSIIDLSTGQQPIYNNDKTALIFFNGEIYNYRELKSDLLDKGFLFDTNSDTEVIVNLYKYYGVSMLQMLKGMFVFCIYDIEKKEYFFARDRFGEKPFFYYHENEAFLFSSEIFSLLTNSTVPRKLNKSLLGVYLERSYVPEPHTLLENVMSLPPGHYLIYKQGKLTVAPYFEVEYRTDQNLKKIDEAAAFIKPFLENAVKRQMISDVPIGAFLSGGIDSSTVVALMQKFSNKPVQTFNVKFQTKGYDESIIAKKVSQKIGTAHHEIVVENNAFREDQFWKILRHTGVPFPDSSAIPTDIVTNIISKHVKVALSGDGGDELFAGYNIFDWVSSIDKVKKLPLSLRKGGGLFIKSLNKIGIGNNRLRQIEKALKISELSSVNLLQQMHALFDEGELSSVYKNESVFSEDITTGEWNNWSALKRSMFYRVKYDLPLDMLVKVDRMSMSNSLEVRNPFLDPDLFEASTKLPDRFLRNGSIGKLVIRKVMEDALPKEVFDHPKSGFSIPLHDFRNETFKKLAADLLNQPYMHLLFNTEALQEIKESGLNDSKDSTKGSIYRKTHQLWSLMMLSGWIKMYRVEI